ncbi:MAG: hypothetical protein BEN19_00545 [Epulopiscium sp. Nuni2H_MBin003]|nr:MAG: hypothetical protein BEN19_00545 [Epulopiscium sp. Nuni2H_MBin003]
MIYSTFNDGEPEHSLLGFGIMRMPVNQDNSINKYLSEQMIDLAYKNGINYFDTSYVYHESRSESFLGQVLAKYPRNSFFVADKMPLWKVENFEDLDNILDEQLARLGMDYIDYYLIHAVNSAYYKKIKQLNVVDWLISKKAQGKIRHIGFSFHDNLDCLKDTLNLYDWDFCQLQINYADWNKFHAKDMYELVSTKNIPIIVMEPIRGGALANPAPEIAAILKDATPDATYANWAFRFVATLPNVKLILSGMSTIEQVQDNLTTFENEKNIHLNENEVNALDKAITIIDNLDTIPCTGCRYCMPCPFSVEIAPCFNQYNNNVIFGTNKYDAERDRANYCVSCKKCIPLCPQNINIPHELEKVAIKFK